MNKFLIIALAVVLTFAGQASAQMTLHTAWAANNGQSGCMFDVNALAAVDITGFQHNLLAGTWDIEIYAHSTLGTYVGNEGNAGAWTLIHSESGVTGLGPNIQGTASTLSTPFNIPGGATQGFYVTVTNGTSMRYTNGSAPGAVWASDSFLEITEGHGMCYAFTCFFLPRNFSGAIDYAPGNVSNDDLSMQSIDAPSSNASACGYPLQSETVSITVLNLGANPVAAGTPIPVSYTADDGVNPATTVNETWTVAAEIMPLTTASFSFAAAANLGGSHSSDIIATASMVGDGDPSNDSKTVTVANGQSAVSSYPWFDDMDSAGPSGSANAPTGWTNSQTDNPGGGSYPDWLARSGTTPSGGTGPLSGDHTSGGGVYMHVEDSGGATTSHLIIDLISPCLDLASLATPSLKFWLCSRNNGAAPDNMLYVDVIDGSGAYNFGPGFGTEADQGWYEKTIDLSAYAGQTIQVVFSGTNDNGTFSHDVCIDDVTVYEPVALNGQPAQAGLAEFDINGATNANGDAVGAYTPGPHSSSVASGTAANIDISGAPGGNAIIVFAGPVNIAAGGVAGVGQFDVGVPSGGPVPGGLSIVADGTNMGGGGFWSSIFNTGASGTMSLSLSFNAPAGLTFGLQAAVFTGGPAVIALSNAIDLTSM